jgi:hypothetical protein
VLVEDVVSEIEECLAGGATLAEIAKTLGLKLNTVQKAMREGVFVSPRRFGCVTTTSPRTGW